jgi:hypothetical protein
MYQRQQSGLNGLNLVVKVLMHQLVGFVVLSASRRTIGGHSRQQD